MNRKQKHMLALISILALTFGIVPNVNAMHIMEGFLPVSYCVIWGLICVPFLVIGFMHVDKQVKENRQTMMRTVMGLWICPNRNS